VSKRRQQLAEQYGEELVCADGFDEAILGVMTRVSKPDIVIYDYQRCVEIIMRDHECDYVEAVEHMEYNVAGCWIGEDTPGFLRRLEEPSP
jgi:hypothetical protein